MIPGHSWAFSGMVGAEVSALSHLSIVMVQTDKERNGNHPGSCLRSGTRCSSGVGNLLSDPLMGSCLVEVSHLGMEDAVELPLMEDQQVIKAFTPHT